MLEIGGKSAGQQFGFSIGALGDLNGDGVTEYAVGERLYDDEGHGINAGRFHVMNGESGEPLFSHSRLIGHGPSSLSGNFDRMGGGVSTAGDFDGDGVEDL